MTPGKIIIHRWGDYPRENSFVELVAERVIGPREFDAGVREINGLEVLSGELVWPMPHLCTGVRRDYSLGGARFIYDYSEGHTVSSGFRVNEFVEVQGSAEQARTLAEVLRGKFSLAVASH